ncbi:hypothetical protein QBC43DRAFT_299984 [Cladorrhinum sp. PSN259]|nr:hypothetical protein QBC43DRAFT_299984 [Cladorrhinum sp. PSN259]
MYESYLEWRKANEPGYHMKCKMRQAHRVVRHYQGSTLSTATGTGDKGITGDANVDWKTISEKAKAAVNAAAAAAVKEKKTREQLVREELKAKVKLASAAIEKKQQQNTETQQTETIKKEEAGTVVSAAA